MKTPKSITAFICALLFMSLFLGCSNPEVTEDSGIPNAVAIKMQDSTALGQPYYLIQTNNYDYYVVAEKTQTVVKKSYVKGFPYWALFALGLCLGVFIGIKVSEF